MPVDVLLRHLRTQPTGLALREADRRLRLYGPNVLERRGGSRWPRRIALQFVHPLALLLEMAAALAAAEGTWVLCGAILAVLAVNAVFALLQERQAERSVEALAALMPSRAQVLRDGTPVEVDARDLVPGDVMLIREGMSVSADARLIEGAADIDMSALTGESMPVLRRALAPGEQPARSAAPHDAGTERLAALDLLFSGTQCVAGDCRAVVVATGLHTELGRIASLSRRDGRQESPLERQVRRVAWVIALVAVAAGTAFIPLGVLAGLSVQDSLSLAIGLIVANVPEGLLPTITLALAVGVRLLARRGALVKRLSAVETLGSTTVICTDKTGTLTENRMHPVQVWTADGLVDLEARALYGDEPVPKALATSLATSTTTQAGTDGGRVGDPTEVGLWEAVVPLGGDPAAAGAERLTVHVLDPRLRRMSVVTRTAGLMRIDAKGAPESLVPLCTHIARGGGVRPLHPEDVSDVERALGRMAADGLRVIAVAQRIVGTRVAEPATREETEADLCLLGLVGLLDPPRIHVADAVDRCHTAGMSVHVVTGDNGLTAAAIARRLGIGGPGGPRVVTGAEVDAMGDRQLDALLREPGEVVFARSSPETKLRIVDSLRAGGQVVAVTGDGVNDAPALRAADIGVAMGESGTDVAREAATMVLTEDDFAGIVEAVAAGRRVYENVRKFVLYIFAHATPEIAPFLVFALSGGAVPLGLTVLQILAIDLGTETLPALALGRERAEPGIMDRPPRRRGEGIITRGMLVRAWAVLGVTSAVLSMGAFLLVLWRAGWSWGADTGEGSPLHDAYLQATTMTFAAIVACQVGVAMAARTTTAGLRQVGVLGNRLLVAGIAFEIALVAVLVYVPPLADVFGLRRPDWWHLLLLVPMPVLVWGADALLRAAWNGRAAAIRPGG